MIGVVNPAGADGNTYEKITGEAETLDILTFVKEHMENGSVILLKIFLLMGMQQRAGYQLISPAERKLISCLNFTRKQRLGVILKMHGENKILLCLLMNLLSFFLQGAASL